jgi:hypothetical protein
MNGTTKCFSGKISPAQLRIEIEQTAREKLPEDKYRKLIRCLNCTNSDQDLARECFRILEEELQD